MTDVLFGHSYYLRFDPKLWQAMQPYPPLGTLYAASYLRERGYAVALFDAMLADRETEWDDALARHQPRFAVLFEDNFNYLSKMCLLRMREAAFAMIAMARRWGARVIVGADATDHAERYLAQGADFVLLGEGEETLGELLNVLTGSGEGAVEAIAGLAWCRDRNGRHGVRTNVEKIVAPIERTGLRQPMKNLDAMPFPAWDLVDIARYQDVWRTRHGYFSLNMVTTRGCPYHCNWCAKPIWGQRYNVRSPANVVAELKVLKEQYRADHIWFMDDILGLSPGWLGRFAEQVQAEHAVVPFKCLARADLLLRDGAVDALRRAGCRTVWIGAESGSQRILDAMEKGTRVEQIRAATERLHRAGVEVGFFLQFGYPGEGWDDIGRTFRMVWEAKPDEIGMSVSYPLPGTKFYHRVAHELGGKRNWQDSSDMAMLYRGPFPTAFYRTLHTALHREFRLRRAWLGLWKALRAPRSLRARHVRAAVGSAVRALELPFLWLRLRQQRRARHEGIRPFAPVLSPSEAAQPTPREEAALPLAT